MLCRLFLFTLLLSTNCLFGQDNFPAGWANRDANKVIDVIGRRVNYPVYYDKVFYQSATGNSPSWTAPDYGTIAYGLGSCVFGNKRMQWWVRYQVDQSSNMSTFTINPETEFATKTVNVIAENYRKTSCTGSGTTTFQTVSTFTIKFERPEFLDLDDIKTVCNSVDKDYILSDHFSVKDGVTFYLDGSPITILNPSVLTPGFHQLSAVKTYDNGQYDGNFGSRPGPVTIIYDFQVLPSATIDVRPFPATMCQNTDPISITATPAGGQWEGRGIDAAGNFTPATAAIGRNIFTYKYNNPNGCISEKSIEIIVTAPPVVTAGDLDVCRSAPAFTLTNGSPAGGIYSGRGVIGGTTFDPAGAIVGRNPILYNYTDPNTGCTSNQEFDITVIDADNFTTGGDFTTCNTSAEINLNERSGVSPDDGSILWTGPGIVGNKYFDPSAAGIGLHTITAKLYVPTTGCTYEKTIVAKVVQGPTVDAGTDIRVCQNAAPFQIPGATPLGGHWSGDFIQNNTFTPNQAVPGDYVATYTYNTSACTVTDTKVITVAAPPAVNAGNNFTVCRNAGPVALPAPSPTGGSWAPDGSYYNLASNTVDPGKMQIGSNKLVYAYTDGTCTVTDELEITVVLPPAVNAGQDLRTCLNADPLPLGGDPAGGTWSGPGIENNRFIPSRAGLGDHLLTYTVTDPATSCQNADNIYIKVLAPPVVDAGQDEIICTNAADFYLSGATPLGGQWSGDFVDAGYFRTSQAPPGTYVLTYTYSDGTCSASDTKVLQLVAAPVLNAGSDYDICQGDAKQAPPIPRPSGGTWSPLSGNWYDAASNTLDPARMQIGDNYLIYSIITPVGCTVKDTVAITLNPRPPITGMRDFSACLNGATIPLVANPQGGIWEGPGVDNNAGSFFNAADAGAGDHIVTYTLRDAATSCTTIDTVIVKVNTPPAITLPADSAVCIASGAFPLRAWPVGGTWSGSGVTGNTFDPVRAGVGEHVLTYSFTDPATKCSNSATITYSVKGLPGMILIKGDTLSCKGDRVTLTASADNVNSFNWYRENEGQPFASGSTIRFTITKDEKLIAVPLPVKPGDCPGAGRVFSIIANSPQGDISYTGPDTLPYGGLFRATSDLSKAVTYAWSFGDGGTSSQPAGDHYYYQHGQYTVTLEATGSTGCKTVFSVHRLLTVLDENGKIKDPVFDRGDGLDPGGKGLILYPTVFTSRLTIEGVLKDNQEVIIEFIDFNGKKISETKRTGVAGHNKFILDTSKLPGHGTYYFIKVNSGNQLHEVLKAFKL